MKRWEARNFEDGWVEIRTEDGDFVAKVLDDGSPMPSDARLIASAPDMLAALEAVLERYGNTMDAENLVRVRQALAKAGGAR